MGRSREDVCGCGCGQLRRYPVGVSWAEAEFLLRLLRWVPARSARSLCEKAAYVVREASR